ncbi:uncharacterized protein ColSpa_08414 [Colletotrichum spaethianum]|uniref:Uncharacterized protein n=1 Tax=Colletotrichum spaethianum TaxID=700344 RepID=A0AA37P9P0_9PEZI|nr:uncharacterized protein ColSpa_08414 [Colletotrichum spaethianum]GKT48233.1 hypothetical protein ColSpa_08414 [Colletotrichum spaethianum]
MADAQRTMTIMRTVVVLTVEDDGEDGVSDGPPRPADASIGVGVGDEVYDCDVWDFAIVETAAASDASRLTLARMTGAMPSRWYLC